MPRNSRLDALRALAIGGVVLVHTAQQLPGLGPGLLPSVSGLGRFGVQLFFLISGFLLDQLYADRSRTWSLRVYATRRLGRIYPLYFAFAILWIAAVTSGFVDLPDQFFNVFVVAMTILLINDLWWTSAWGFLPGAWSISAEAIHYLLFPLVRTRSRRVLLVLLAVTTAISTVAGLWSFVRTGGDYTGMPGAFYSWVNTFAPWNTVPYFIMGMLLSTFFGSARRTLGKAQRMATVAALILGVLSTQLLGSLTPITLVWVSAIFLLIVLSNWNPPSWVLWIGRRSYATYFTHFVVLALIAESASRLGWSVSAFPPTLALAIGAIGVLAVSSLLSQVLWVVIEGPFIRLTHKRPDPQQPIR